MVYLFETKVPDSKSVVFALRYVYGIGKSNSLFICKKLGFSINLKIKDLSKEQINQLLNTIDSLNVELAGDLKKLNIFNKKKLVSIKSYRGLRRIQGLPVRGQRTHTNYQTSRKIR